jgi:hypothetical protein
MERMYIVLAKHTFGKVTVSGVFSMPAMLHSESTFPNQTYREPTLEECEEHLEKKLDRGGWKVIRIFPANGGLHFLP